jgi:luciferase family oxidoreductase group 1
MQLSVLDQSPVSAGSAEDAAIRESLRLAALCDELGYARYWVAEHHNTASVVGTAPEILMGAIAATTTRIRIGSAGVMLPHYAALKVAEQFRVLEAIAPGRIDLGVGRAPGSDPLTAAALNPRADAVDDFPRQVQELRLWTSGAPLPAGHPFRSVAAHPRGASSPQLWSLGSSDYSAQLTAYLGLPFAYAHFFRDGAGTAEALALYRRQFRPSASQPAPCATICVWALAADTQAEAQRLASTREHWRVGFDKGLREPLISPEAAAGQAYTGAEQALIARLRGNAIVGTAAEVAGRIASLAAQHALDEVVVNTWTYDPQARRHSYELLARELALPAQGAAGR